MNEPSGVEAYLLGREYSVMPIAIDWTHCREIAAGPLVFVVEARSLSEQAIVDNEQAQGTTDGLEHNYELSDGGASLHVLGAHDRIEYLRFDCFDNEPHYHYIDNVRQRNIVVRFDQHAEGDPLQWTVGRIEARLPEMLGYCGAAELAASASEARPEIERAVEELGSLLAEAARRAVALKARPS